MVIFRVHSPTFLYTKLTVSSLITEWNWNNEFRPKEEVGGKAREKTSYQLFNISCFSNQSSATTLWLSLDSWQPSQKWPRLLAALNVANLQKSSSHPSSSTVGIFGLQSLVFKSKFSNVFMIFYTGILKTKLVLKELPSKYVCQIIQ